MDKYYLLVDIDGTLADCTERAKKFLAGENPDWDGFYGACGCGSSGGHYDTWENVFKWYNRVFEKESEQAVNTTWERTKATEV